MGRRQKGKAMKRKRSWHRGGVEAKKSQRALRRWPDTGVTVEPTGEPVPVRRNGSNRVR